jgi:hypothetical protein
MPKTVVMDLEDLTTAVYCALDDALKEAGISAKGGKLLGRRGPRPEVDDREVLCLAVLQELLGFESDHAYHLWLDSDKTIGRLFPRRLSRQNFADRRALLLPLYEGICNAFCDLAGEGTPPFWSSTPIRSTCAGRSEPEDARTGSEGSLRRVTAPR